MQRFPLRFLFLFVVLSVTLDVHPAYAEPPSPALLEKLAAYASSFDRQRTHASYSLVGQIEVVDGDGEVSSKKELSAHVDAQGAEPRVTVLRYVEDGRDKTEDAVKEAREADEKRKKRRDEGKQLKMPILAEQQSRYVFDETERSPDGSRVLVRFVPKSPAEDTVEGSAWVDVPTGTLVSATFKLSKTSFFVDYVHFSVDFGAQTSLGPAVSHVAVDGAGGILFFRKHFRGEATLSSYTITP